jgi:hypothetical protein
MLEFIAVICGNYPPNAFALPIQTTAKAQSLYTIELLLQ